MHASCSCFRAGVRLTDSVLLAPWEGRTGQMSWTQAHLHFTVEQILSCAVVCQQMAPVYLLLRQPILQRNSLYQMQLAKPEESSRTTVKLLHRCCTRNGFHLYFLISVMMASDVATAALFHWHQVWINGWTCSLHTDWDILKLQDPQLGMQHRPHNHVVEAN